MIESVVFVKKGESAVTQVADMLTYVTKRAIAQKRHAQWQFGSFAGEHIQIVPTVENDPVRQAITRYREGTIKMPYPSGPAY